MLKERLYKTRNDMITKKYYVHLCERSHTLVLACVSRSPSGTLFSSLRCKRENNIHPHINRSKTDVNSSLDALSVNSAVAAKA